VTPPPMNRIPLERSSRKLPVKLTEAEHNVKAVELARAQLRHDALLEEHKEAKAVMRQEAKAAHAKIRELTGDVATGTEQRMVQCREVIDFDQHAVYVVRLDTGVVIESRALNEQDRQLAIEHQLDAQDLEDIAVEPIWPDDIEPPGVGEPDPDAPPSDDDTEPSGSTVEDISDELPEEPE
jgi:hypothetical protein